MGGFALALWSWEYFNIQHASCQLYIDYKWQPDTYIEWMIAHKLLFQSSDESYSQMYWYINLIVLIAIKQPFVPIYCIYKLLVLRRLKHNGREILSLYRQATLILFLSQDQTKSHVPGWFSL